MAFKVGEVIGWTDDNYLTLTFQNISGLRIGTPGQVCNTAGFPQGAPIWLVGRCRIEGRRNSSFVLVYVHPTPFYPEPGLVQRS